MNKIDELTEYFKRFPGVGPKQANRFTYYLLKKGKKFSYDLSNKINEIHNEVHVCENCFQYYLNKNKQNEKTIKCNICSSKNRNTEKILIVANDIDAKIIEKSGSYDGLYFVLGGLVPVLSLNIEKIIRLNELKNKIVNSIEIKEVIFALSANPEGENTADIISNEIKSLQEDKKLHNLLHLKNLKISKLGRGLSTGSEIEYTDPETLKNALKNRF